MSCSSSCGSGCSGCKALVAIVAIVTTATTVAALIGVYMKHVTTDGWVFGTMEGSLAIVALIVSVMCWLKLVKKLCPCSKSGSVCSGCGHSPCSC